jgi:methylmalonyl-CoA/ethylmalonyl-CoA epimerase
MAANPVALESVGQISIIVKDVERARDFYRDTLGLTFLFEFPGMAFFDCGGVRLYLAPADKPGLGTSILYYRVADIRTTATALESRGVTFLQQPAKVHEDARHELWLAFFEDSEGNTVALMSEVPTATPR